MGIQLLIQTPHHIFALQQPLHPYIHLREHVRLLLHFNPDGFPFPAFPFPVSTDLSYRTPFRITGKNWVT
jgi:hypothetical protein